MRRAFNVFLALAVILAYQPIQIGAQQLGEVSGTAVVEGKPLGNALVRLRNVDTGAEHSRQRTNEAGEFKFTAVPIGNYVVETLGEDGTTLLAASSAIAVTTQALAITGVTVATSAAAAAAAGVGAAAVGIAAGAAGAAVGGAVGIAAGAAGAFFATTLGVVTAAAVAASVAAASVTATGEDPSPSS